MPREFRTGDAATDLMVKTLQGVIERMGKDLDRERDRVDQLTAQLTRLAERSLPAPPPGPELSHLRRAWRWMRKAG